MLYLNGYGLIADTLKKMPKKYQLDRKRFILYYQDTYWLTTMIKKKTIIQDLIKGSEYIITAQDILNKMETIPGCLVGVDGRVLVSDCELVYTE